ncbi:LysR family transcriptional regulator [Pendulispora rubella]|uniref:LysR family transcriptional regulator n=1 Tax=Pendulispora rubella TaxID=2741070 RepID=A0ABZ2LJS5_9BACT
MKRIDLRRTNLNLLLVFDVLMTERHVGRAASRLGLTQSAVSHSLVRLREALGDPLFVRHPKGVEPTPRALELAVKISPILDSAQAVLSSAPSFEPGRPHTFSIGGTDGAINAVLVPLMERVRAEAPAIDVRVRATSRDSLLSALDRMEIDMALSVFSAPIARVTRIPVMKMDFVGIARRGHPAIGAKKLTVERFAALEHLVISPQPDGAEPIDEQLAERGLKRRIVVVEPHYLAAPLIVARTDLVAIVDRRLARLFAAHHALTLFEPPILPPPTTLDMLMSVARANEPPLRWLQAQIKAALAGG